MCGNSLRQERSSDQTTGGGSNPTLPLQKTLRVRKLSAREANRLLERWHYLGSVRGIVHAWGHEEGCCVFTNCRSRLLESRFKTKGIVPIELARMVGCPNHVWAMSSLMKACVAELKKLGQYDIIVTYADPFAGHSGAVYRAANWDFDGFTVKDGHPLIFIDDKLVAPRTLYDCHGTQSISRLKEIYGSRLQTIAKPPKKRFVKYLTQKGKTYKGDS